MHEAVSISDQPQGVQAARTDAMQPELSTTLYEHLPIQLKLSVGAVNDPLEHEADAMADKVMRMPETPFIQRRAAAHDPGDYDDEHVRLKSLGSHVTPFIQTKGDGGGAVSDSVSSQIKASMGSGNVMDGGTKSFMESRFGTDFSNVKIHNGDESIQLNRELNAKAFTVSNNIYFNSGQYQPQTDTGKHLLAHELTHVVQQGSLNNNIQRQSVATPVEFNITGTSTDNKDHKIYFDKDEDKIDKAGSTKIGNLIGRATPITGQIELRGFKSEEETVALAQNRIDAVKKEFTSNKAFSGTFTSTPMPSAGDGAIDYRSLRSVEIIEAGQKSTTPNCKTTPAHFACPSATESNFQAAVVEAKKDIKTATGLLSATVRSTATNDLLDKFFGMGVAGKGAAVLSTLLANMPLIDSQISRIKDASHHQCANSCDSNCAGSTIAYNEDVGKKAKYTICPTFDTLKGDDRARNMIHECAHGTAGIISKNEGTDDFAYRHERLINLLDPLVALKNSDSYALLIMFLVDPAFVSRKPAVDDTSLVSNPVEKAQIGLPIANLEKWLTFAQQETAALYGVINDNPSATDWNSSHYLKTMDIWASNFSDLTPAKNLPNHNDQLIIAGINDRVNTMARGAKESLTFSRPAVKDTDWEFSSDNVIGKKIKIGDDFIAATDTVMKTMILLKAIVHSNMKILPSFEAGYVDSIDRLRKRH